MTDQDELKPLFKELDGATLFEAVQVWESTTGVMCHAIGTWPWEDIGSVEQVSDGLWPDIRPLCALKWQGTYLHLHVDYRTAQTAWRRHRLSYGSKALRWTSSN